MRVLVVEDDEGVAAGLTQGLKVAGWSVRHAGTARAGLDLVPDDAAGAAEEDRLDLVLLDMGLPDHDGLWLCARIRERSGVPIVALTARRAESSVVGALRAGVDDYVTKPYSLPVLLARMEAVLRRTTGAAVAPPAPDLPVDLDVETRELHTPEGTVGLTAKECELLLALARGAGRPLSRAALMEEVWDTTWVGASRTLDVHVASLRAKLGSAARIETVRGVGYRLLVEEG
ncbi:response regulator transcription factor [Nocardioides litoris]|uniref:response regulator transcription factor n=1 Tax=Nocardioides litoris TaxID=1926648 RepID=UPI00111E9F27|nr:response regulator transcription factor [Nocardioides litoris]